MTPKQTPAKSTKLLDGGILYYPTIEIQDDAWLKSALCVWDRIYRIVPVGYKPRDTVAVQKAADAGLVESIHVSEADLTVCGKAFEKFWSKTPVIPCGLQSNQQARLHEEKIDQRVLPILKKLKVKTASGGFLDVPKEVADTYMLFLADAVSRRRSVAKLTNDSDMFAIMHYFASNGNMDEFLYTDDLPEISVSLTLTTVVPAGLDNAPIEKVIAFRKNSAEPRQAFRDKITGFAQELSQVEDERHAQSLAADFANKIQQNAEQKASIMNQLGLVDIPAMISIGLPTALTAWSTAVAAGKGFDPFFIGGSVLTGFVAAMADATKSRRKEWKKTDTFYYFTLERAFREGNTTQFSVPHYAKLLEEFMND
jgi:hypothetical protein